MIGQLLCLAFGCSIVAYAIYPHDHILSAWLALGIFLVLLAIAPGGDT